MKKFYIFLGFGLLVSLLIATLFDLNIAQFIFWEGNMFSDIMYNLTPVLYGSLFILSATLIFFSMNIQKNIFIKIVGSIVSILSVALGTFLSFGYIGIFGIIYSLIIVVLFSLFVRSLSAENKKRALNVGFFMFLTLLCSMIVVESIKPIVGRVRFRSLQDQLELFTPWYQVNGKKYLSFVPAMEEIKSFPSGHSQWAGCMLVVSALTLIKPAWEKYEKPVFIITIAYAVIVMLSRMMQGAHYLSDVTVGFSSAFLFYLLFKKIFLNFAESKN